MPLRRGWCVVLLFVTILFITVRVEAVKKVVTHYCFVVPTDANQVNIQTRILINGDPVNSVYAFDANTGDTSQLVDRTTDPDCVKDQTGIVDKSANPILYDFTVTITDVSHKCGVSVVTNSDGVNIVLFLFRIYAYSDTVNNLADASFMAMCRMDDLTGAAVATKQIEIMPPTNIIRQQQSVGAYLRLRFSDTLSPVTVANVGDKITLSVEFYPNLQMGPDNFGSHFMIGFLGIDPIAEPAASELYLIVIPRYNIRTDILVTTKYGQDEYFIEDGTPLKIVIPSDLMGCSDGGVAEIQDKGVEITTYDMEVGLLVCSKETGTADCYTALPTDVTGTSYVTSSMYAADEASELMIVSQYDDTQVIIDIPGSLGHTITLNGTSTAAGGDLLVTLDKRMVFHLAQSSPIATTSTVSGYHISTDKPVTVISGSRNYADDHLMEQIPPTAKFGTHYVLIPADIVPDSRATTYIIQAVEIGDTVVTRYLSSSTFDTHTVAFGEYLSIDVASGEPCELTADKPVMVTQVVNAPTSSGFEPSMVIMPSVNQWAPKYTFYHSEYTLTVLSVVKESHKSYFKVNSGSAVLQSTLNVLGPNGYIFGANFLNVGMRTVEIQDADVLTTFMAIGYLSDGMPGSSNTGIAVHGWGYRQSDRGACVPVGRINDLVDNDCDGLIDEELPNAKDDDGDGEVDEDVSGDTSEYAGAVAIRPIKCQVSADSSFNTPTKTHNITGPDGCTETSDLFAMNGNFVPQTGANIGTGILPKILQSGDIEVSQYIGEPMLYFKCDIEFYCTSATDTQCTEICSAPVTRRKRREDETQKINNVTAKIWVSPYNTGTHKPTIKESVTSLSACMGNTFVQLSLASMGVLATVCFFSAICFCCLFRKMHKKDKQRDRKMHYNGFHKWS